jgi:hypothetical protein
MRDGCSEDDPFDPDLDMFCHDIITFRDVEVYGVYDHSTFGLGAVDPYAAARANLDACITAQLEAQLWGISDGGGGATDPAGVGSPVIVDSTGMIVVSGGPFEPGDALERLIGAVGGGEGCDCGFVHYIHASPRLVSAWLNGSEGLTKMEGRVLYTFNNHVIIAGSGYPGTAPDGEDPGVDIEWAYATSPVGLYLSRYFNVGEPVEPDAGNPASPLELRDNEGVFVVQRHAVPYFNPGCCRVGIEVNLSCTAASGS